MNRIHFWIVGLFLFLFLAPCIVWAFVFWPREIPDEEKLEILSRPASAIIHLHKGLDAFYEGDLVTAEQALQRTKASGIEMGPYRMGRLHETLGLIRIEQGAYEDAIDAYNEALEIGPNWARGLNGRGVANELAGNVEAAKADYNRAANVWAGKYYAARMNLARIAESEGEMDRALELLTESIEIAGNSAPVYLARGNFFARRGDWARAKADYNKALELVPEYPEALNNRGVASLNLRETRQALQDFAAAIDLDDTFALAYHNRAIARDKVGDTQGATDDKSHYTALTAESK